MQIGHQKQTMTISGFKLSLIKSSKLLESGRREEMLTIIRGLHRIESPIVEMDCTGTLTELITERKRQINILFSYRH